MLKSAYEGVSMAEAPMRSIMMRCAAGAVPGRNFTAMLPRRYGTPFRLDRSVGYGRGGRGASELRRPLSIPGGVRSEMNVRNPGAASCAATTPRASATRVRTPAVLERNINASNEGEQAGGSMLLQVLEWIDSVLGRVHRFLDRRRLLVSGLPEVDFVRPVKVCVVSAAHHLHARG